jgi:hypothetical protein
MQTLRKNDTEEKMRRLKMVLTMLMMAALAGFMVQSAYAWCTPRILHCGDVIDSNTVHGHDDISRYNCTGNTNWNGKAHVYKIHHPGDTLSIHLGWSGSSTHELHVFLLTDCNQNHCIAHGSHDIMVIRPLGDYWIIVDSKTDAGTSYHLTVDCRDHPLPVELLGFSAEDRTDGIHLAWSTATETGNQGFRLERQMQDQENWDLLSFIPGQGQSVTRADYTYIDTDALLGMTYAYRLLILDNSGEYTELQLITAGHGVTTTTESPADYTLLGNFPNPFNPTTQIRFDVADANTISLQVFDITGQLVSTLASGYYPAGSHQVTFDASALPSGVYFAQLSGGSVTKTIKMVLLK